MIVVVICFLVLFLLFAPTHIVLQYTGEKFVGYVRFWFIVKIPIFGAKKKKEESQKEKETDSSRIKMQFSDRLDQLRLLLSVAVDVVKNFCKHFVLYKCRIVICVGGDDPADVATEFGLVNAAAYGIISFLSDKIKIKKKEILISYDFDKDNSSFEVDFRFRVILIKFLLILICTNIRDIISLLQLNSKSQEIQKEVK